MAPGVRPFEGARVLGRFAGYLGVEPAEVYELFDIVNLIDHWPGPSYPGSKNDAFPRDLAEVGAGPVRERVLEGSWRRVVTLGRAVTDVFWGTRRARKVLWFDWRAAWPLMQLPESVLGAASPHPGGTSMAWNDLELRRSGIEFWRSVRDYARQ